MAWPGSYQELVIRSLGADKIGPLRIKTVSIVDAPGEISWKRTRQGLVLTTPHRAPNKIAICYRIKTEGLAHIQKNKSVSRATH